MSELLEYFTKIIKQELGLDVAPPDMQQTEEGLPESEMPTTIPSQPTSSPEVQIPQEKTEVNIIRISPETIKDLVLQLIQTELNNLRAELLQTINHLKARIDKLEQAIKDLSKQPLQAPREVPQETITIPSYSGLQTDDLDLLLHEAKELIADQAVNLVKLIRLEAIEWQLIKASSKNENRSKVPPDLLKTLRLEINRLRKLLL